MWKMFKVIQDYLMSLTSTLEPSPWRIRTRIAAYVELALALATALFAVWLAIQIAVLASSEHDVVNGTQNLTSTNSTQEYELDISPPRYDTITGILSVVTFVATVTFFDVWSATLLFKATKLGGEAKLSRERARYWCYIQLVLLVLAGQVTLFLRCYKFFALKLFGRVVLMIIVRKYIMEITMNLNASKPGGYGLRVVTSTA